jgi:hypothetical protein
MTILHIIIGFVFGISFKAIISLIHDIRNDEYDLGRMEAYGHCDFTERISEPSND